MTAAPSSRRRGRRVAAVVALATIVLAAGCSGDGGSAEADTTAPTEAAVRGRVEVSAAEVAGFDGVDGDDLAGPGTPLGAGLRVPEGSLLQGVAFPDLVGGGFRALLLIIGDPVDVFDDLGAQAATLGMAGSGGCLGIATEVGCRSERVDSADGESLAVVVSRKVAATGVVSGASLHYRPPGSDDGAAVAEAASPPTTPLPEVVLPDLVPAPATEDIALAVRPPASPARMLERGAELVGLPGPCACDGPGWSMVVRLDAVERDVLAAYGRQFSDLGEPVDIEDRHREDVTVMGVRIGDREANAEIRALLPDDGQGYAIISVRPG